MGTLPPFCAARSRSYREPQNRSRKACEVGQPDLANVAVDSALTAILGRGPRSPSRRQRRSARCSSSCSRDTVRPRPRRRGSRAAGGRDARCGRRSGGSSGGRASSSWRKRWSEAAAVAPSRVAAWSSRAQPHSPLADDPACGHVGNLRARGIEGRGCTRRRCRRRDSQWLSRRRRDAGQPAAGGEGRYASRVLLDDAARRDCGHALHRQPPGDYSVGRVL
jgi:hypothetical protein